MNRQKPIEHHKKSTNPIFFHPSTSLCNDTRFIARFENSRDRSLAGLQLHLHFRAIFGFFLFYYVPFHYFFTNRRKETSNRRRHNGGSKKSRRNRKPAFSIIQYYIGECWLILDMIYIIFLYM